MNQLRTSVFLTLLLVAGSARAVPPVDSARPEITLVDAWDRPLAVRRATTKPLLVFYEDKDSATQNAALKDELARLGRAERYKRALSVLAIADVSGYDYWPARGFVKDALQSESRKLGTVIYCDWTGAAQRAFGVRRGVSNVVLYSGDGKVLLSHEGAMPAEKRAELVALVRALAGES